MGRMSHTEQLRLRLLGSRPTDRLAGWLGPLLVALYAGVLRFWQLGRPDTLIFDETYYVKQAWSLLTFGVGFVVRPLGALVFGWFGDKVGARPPSW